ncbi:MAG: alpha-amylase family glycosyl hydrolase [bacterium]
MAATHIRNLFVALVLACSLAYPLACGPRQEALAAGSAAGSAAPPSEVVHPEWARNLALYEVNIRQYSPGGTFKEFEQHLGRLKQMGVGILWLMPVHPIGELNRKGTLGSYYSVRDYLAVNPEFGTMEDFKSLVAKIHDAGMYVIIDWVANHTAWDNPLTVEHPEWFTRDGGGNLKPPVPDWSDVVDLNYDNPDLWSYMIDAMKFWVRETGIDGFRCDVAEMVPVEFWAEARAELDQIRPVFMLAEGEQPALHERAFDATYGWQLFKLMRKIAEGSGSAVELWNYFDRDAVVYPGGAYRMYFTSNHDENSWNGTAGQFFGEGIEAFAVLTLTARGIPLIYSGEEAGLGERLAFFDKDSISWRPHGLSRLYTDLLQWKRVNKALWNGEAGGAMVRVPTSNDGAVFAFMRQRDECRVVVAMNLSLRTQEVELRSKSVAGDYGELVTRKGVRLDKGTVLKLKPWEYRVYVTPTAIPLPGTVGADQ